MRLDDGRSKTQFAVVESRVPPSASCCCSCCGGLVAVGEGLVDGELEVLAARVESILMGCVMTGVVVGGTPSCSRSSTNTHSPDIESAIVAMLSVYLSLRPPTHSDTTERQGHGTPRTVLLYPGDRGVGAVECRSVARALSNWPAALVCCWFGWFHRDAATAMAHSRPRDDSFLEPRDTGTAQPPTVLRNPHNVTQHQPMQTNQELFTALQ